jgi:hypothetical protein
VLGLKNLTAHGPICAKCGKDINTLEGRWVRTTKPESRRTWHGFRFPQLAAPYTDYKEIIISLEQNPTGTLQESFALSVTEAQQVFTDAHIEALSDPKLPNSEDYVLSRAGVYPYYVGVDWGGGGAAATVIVFAAYIRSVFTFLGGFRYYDAPVPEFAKYASEMEIEAYVPFAHLIRRVRVAKAGADIGMGYIRNRMLVSILGSDRFIQVQYTNQATAVPTMKPYDLVVNVPREEMLSNFVTALKLSPGKFRLPRISDMKAAHWYQDLKAVKQEVDKKGKLRYIHSEGETDDFFHAMFNCILASHIAAPRLDMFPSAAFRL